MLPTSVTTIAKHNRSSIDSVFSTKLLKICDNFLMPIWKGYGPYSDVRSRSLLESLGATPIRIGFAPLSYFFFCAIGCFLSKVGVPFSFESNSMLGFNFFFNLFWPDITFHGFSTFGHVVTVTLTSAIVFLNKGNFGLESFVPAGSLEKTIESKGFNTVFPNCAMKSIRSSSSGFGFVIDQSIFDSVFGESDIRLPRGYTESPINSIDGFLHPGIITHKNTMRKDRIYEGL